MGTKWAKSCNVMLLVGAALLTVLSGCGGPAYDRLFAKRLAGLRAGAPFRILYGPKRIDDTQFLVRVPIAFRKSYTPESAHPDDNGPIRPDRLQPPFLQLPGLKTCYEGTVDHNGSKLPFYCYLAVDSGADFEALQKDLLAKLKAKFPKAPDEWKTVDAQTPEDKAVQWKMIRVEAEQPFLVSGQVEPRMMPGIFELWVHAAQNDVVLIGWRTPSEINSNVAPPTQQEALRMLNSESPPDFSTMPSLTAGTIKVEPVPENTG